MHVSTNHIPWLFDIHIEETKKVVRSSKSKDRKYNDQKKNDEKTNNSPQSTTHKANDSITLTSLKIGSVVSTPLVLFTLKIW